MTIKENEEQNISQNKKKIKKNKIPKRCESNECNKKIKLMHFKCKCEKYFCIIHCSAEKHSCDFDYFAENQKKLDETMVDSNFKKVDKI